jgi:hypothetical protein
MDVNPAVLLAEPAAFVAGLAVLRVPVARVREGRTVALAAMAAISALAAVTTGAAATGWAPLDVVLLAATGATAVLAGSEAPSRLILVLAVVAAAAGTGSAALPLALAAVGLVLVSLLFEIEPLIDAAAAGLVAQAALRLTSPGGRGLTAVVAGLILVTLFVAAARTLERRDRRTLIRVGLGVAAFAVVGGIVGAIAAASAVGPLRRGLSVATATIDATQSVELETTAAGLSQAGEDFAEARRALEAWWALPARVVPVVSQHWRVLQAAAVTGDQLAEAGHRALNAPALADVHITDGRVPLEQLAAIEPPVADVAARATEARRRLDDARSTWLVPQLSDELDARLERVRDIERTTQLANRVLPMMPDLLGRDGPRRYFLAVQTPVEARAGGGFLGNFGEITAENGRLSLTRFGRQDELTQAPGREKRTLDAPEDYLARYQRFAPAQNWVNVNLSPDFPTDAAAIADLYPQSGGAPVDGVIAVDPAGLAALLAVVGPVEVPSWPTPINASNALQVLLFDQYQRLATGSEGERLDFLGDVAQVAWGRLTGGQLPPVPQLMASFGPAVRDKHLLFWSNRPDEQELFVDLGAAGEMAPPDSDFMGLVTQNAGGNKIDYFLRREVDYRAELDPSSGRLRARATVTLHNDAPPAGLSFSLIGNELIPALPNGTNKLYLSFYTPWDLVGAKVDGTPVALEEATELGRQVYSTAVVIPPKSTATVELTLAGRLPDADDYHLDVYRQPVVAPDEVSATLVVPSGWRTAAGGTEQTESRRIESDTTLDVPLRRR